MAASIRELIVANIEAVLKTVRPPAYQTALLDVSRFRTGMWNPKQFPAAAVYEVMDEPLDYGSVSNTGIEDRILHVVVEAWVREQKSGQLSQELNQLYADVYAALTLDNQRGGAARDTQLSTVATLTGELGKPEAGLQIAWRIKYRHPYGDAAGILP